MKVFGAINHVLAGRLELKDKDTELLRSECSELRTQIASLRDASERMQKELAEKDGELGYQRDNFNALREEHKKLQAELTESKKEASKSDGELKDAQRRLKIISAALGGAQDTGAGAKYNWSQQLQELLLPLWE
jgi:chromosome segregation ATPase